MSFEQYTCKTGPPHSSVELPLFPYAILGYYSDVVGSLTRASIDYITQVQLEYDTTLRTIRASIQVGHTGSTSGGQQTGGSGRDIRDDLLDIFPDALITGQSQGENIYSNQGQMTEISGYAIFTDGTEQLINTGVVTVPDDYSSTNSLGSNILPDLIRRFGVFGGDSWEHIRHAGQLPTTDDPVGTVKTYPADKTLAKFELRTRRLN